MNWQRGSTRLEFALAWPVALLLVLGCVQLGLYSVEAYSARAAAMVGARAGAARGGTEAGATAATLAALNPSLVGIRAKPFCRNQSGPRAPVPPPLWVCTVYSAHTVTVEVGGRVPALVPLLDFQPWLPVAAHAVLATEVFNP